MVDTTTLIAVIPGETLSRQAIDLKAIDPELGSTWSDGGYRDELGNIWLDNAALKEILPREFVSISLCCRDLNVLQKDGRTYARGPLVAELIETVMEQGRESDRVSAETSRKILEAVRKSGETKTTPPADPDSLRESVATLVWFLDEESRESKGLPFGGRILSQLKCDLLVLLEEKPRTISELADQCKFTTGPIKAAVDDLEADGLVTKKLSAFGMLSLTDAGREFVNKSFPDLSLVAALIRVRKILKARKLSPQTFQILRLLAEKPRSVKELAGHFRGSSFVAVENRYQQLARQGLVDRPSEAGSENLEIRVNEKGSRKVARIAKKIATIARESAGAWPVEVDELNLSLRVIMEWSNLN